MRQKFNNCKKNLENLGDSNDDIKRDRDEKKKYLMRKLTFRPSVDDLRKRKVRLESINEIMTLKGSKYLLRL